MFKHRKKIAITSSNTNILYKILTTPKKYNLSLVREISDSDKRFRYLIDSRLGIVYVDISIKKSNYCIVIKESIKGLFAPFFLLTLGFILLCISKTNMAIILLITSLIYLYIIYVNFSYSKKDILALFS